MKTLRAVVTAISKFIAFILALVFVVVTVIVLAAFNVERAAFDAGVYKRALLNENIYERLPALAAGQLITQMNYDPCRDNPGAVENPDQCQDGQSGQPEEGGPPPFVMNVTQDQWEQILSDLLPPDLLQSQTESALDQIFEYLNTPSGDFTVQISTVDLKKRVSGEAGMNAALTIIRALPPCTFEQLATGGGMEEGFPACRPPEEVIAALEPDIEKQLQQVVKGIPDVITPGQGNGPLNPETRAQMQKVRLIIRLSPLVSLVLLGLIALFGVRSLKGWLRWWGWPLVIVALLAALAVALAEPVLAWLFTNRVMTQLPPYLYLDIARAIFGVAVEIARSVTRMIGLQALLLGLVGLGMVVVSFFVKGAKPAQPS